MLTMSNYKHIDKINSESKSHSNVYLKTPLKQGYLYIIGSYLSLSETRIHIISVSKIQTPL